MQEGRRSIVLHQQTMAKPPTSELYSGPPRRPPSIMRQTLKALAQHTSIPLAMLPPLDTGLRNLLRRRFDVIQADVTSILERISFPTESDVIDQGALPPRLDTFYALIDPPADSNQPFLEFAHRLPTHLLRTSSKGHLDVDNCSRESLAADVFFRTHLQADTKPAEDPMQLLKRLKIRQDHVVDKDMSSTRLMYGIIVFRQLLSLPDHSEVPAVIYAALFALFVRCPHPATPRTNNSGPHVFDLSELASCIPNPHPMSHDDHARVHSLLSSLTPYISPYILSSPSISYARQQIGSIVKLYAACQCPNPLQSPEIARSLAVDLVDRFYPISTAAQVDANPSADSRVSESSNNHEFDLKSLLDILALFESSTDIDIASNALTLLLQRHIDAWQMGIETKTDATKVGILISQEVEVVERFQTNRRADEQRSNASVWRKLLNCYSYEVDSVGVERVLDVCDREMIHVTSGTVSVSFVANLRGTERREKKIDF